MKNRLGIAILTTGFSGMVAQMLLLREMLIVFAGNELSIGIVLANWLVLEAFGSFFIGKKAEKSVNRTEIFILITILFSLFLPVSVYMTRILKNILDLPIGEAVGFLPILFSSFLILLPVSVTHSALFAFGCKLHSIASGRKASSVGRIYVYEIAGTVIGGIIWTYIFIPHLHAFYVSIGLAVLNFLVCVLLLAPYWKPVGLFRKTITVASYVFLFIGVYAIFTGWSDKLHRFSINAQWRGHNVVH